jgi:hypothetical protein
MAQSAHTLYTPAEYLTLEETVTKQPAHPIREKLTEENYRIYSKCST